MDSDFEPGQAGVPLVNRVTALRAHGQSVWLGDISRDMIVDGRLAWYINQVGITGLTSNPTVFERPLTGRDLDLLWAPDQRVRHIAESLVIEDIRRAADLFRSVYDLTDGADGFVSIEVSPHAARDPETTWREANRLWGVIDRPNLMVKVPGTTHTVAAIEDLLAAGINVNVTLPFSLYGYERVAWVYIAALERRLAAGLPIDRVASVASCCISHVDALVDRRLETCLARECTPSEEERYRFLWGRVAISNAKVLYSRFRHIFAAPRWVALEAAGARLQRLLWAGTTPRNPAIPATFYVDQLIGPETVTAMAHITLNAYLDHGNLNRAVDRHVEMANRVMRELAEVGVDVDDLNDDLEAAGIAAFAHSCDAMLSSVAAGGVPVRAGDVLVRS